MSSYQLTSTRSTAVSNSRMKSSDRKVLMPDDLDITGLGHAKFFPSGSVLVECYDDTWIRVGVGMFEV